MIKIQQFPSLALKNKNRLNNSNMAGCFGCLKIFKANEVVEFTDSGETGLCPFCKQDLVISDEKIFEITETLLTKANNAWIK